MHPDQTGLELAQLLLRLHPQGPVRPSRQVRHRLRLARLQVRSGRSENRRRHRPVELQHGTVFGSGLERGRGAEQLLLGRARRQEALRHRRGLHGAREAVQVRFCSAKRRAVVVSKCWCRS